MDPDQMREKVAERMKDPEYRRQAEQALLALGYRAPGAINIHVVRKYGLPEPTDSKGFRLFDDDGRPLSRKERRREAFGRKGRKR